MWNVIRHVWSRKVNCPCPVIIMSCPCPEITVSDSRSCWSCFLSFFVVDFASERLQFVPVIVYQSHGDSMK